MAKRTETDGDHEEEGGRAVEIDQERRHIGRGDGAECEEEHQRRRELDPFVVACKVMGMGRRDRVDREGRQPEQRSRQHDPRGTHGSREIGHGAASHGSDGKPDQYPAAVVFVSEPAYGVLRKRSPDNEGGEEIGDLVRVEPDFRAVERADHAEGGAGKRCDHHAGGRQRRAVDGETRA